MGQNETKICLHLPKKEMKLRPDLKAGNQRRGQGQQEKTGQEQQETVRHVAAKKEEYRASL